MKKKSLNYKEIKKLINENRKEGKTNQEIYNELLSKHSNKRELAILITGTVRKEDKEKYKIYNTILASILGVSLLLKIVFVIVLSIKAQEPWLLLLLLVAPLLTGYFMLKILKYEAPFYRGCGLLAIAGFLMSLSKYGNISENILYILLDLIFVISVAALSFYLEKKMFPAFNLKKLKANENGEYSL